MKETLSSFFRINDFNDILNAGQEITSSTSSQENSHNSYDIPDTTELDSSNTNHGEAHILTVFPFIFLFGT